MSENKSTYHHGDLPKVLLQNATELIREGGIKALSMRKLAERTDVSRTAPYHHFKDKNELLCAIAEQGFQRQDQALKNLSVENPGQDNRQLFERYVLAYIRYAYENPETYDLMFGKEIWKLGTATESLKQISRTSFRHWVDWIEQLQLQDIVSKQDSTLRVAQASWATLHGLCRLLIDGIYLNPEDLEEMGKTAVRMLTTPPN
ncbi:MAG: TetR/AcrR family transcriptional regulator [Motiliproteus sp.]|nr:TetR/AcrR family transcriptional regulator [Motiliproteus sp.]MCW9052685.1 TetR/AcrR family transcriptional regulator [Motiliproteus sp.]